MNLSLISSFIIGTILLLSLLKVNMNLAENSMDSMNDHIAKVNINNVAKVINHDFRKIGYGISGTSLQEATLTRISFEGDLDDDGVVDQVSWEYDTAQEVTETTNPDDYVLIRTINGTSTPIKLGVVKFELTYYDAQNQITTILDDIRRIDIQMICESASPIDGKYMEAGWEKKFIPLNIIN